VNKKSFGGDDISDKRFMNTDAEIIIRRIIECKKREMAENRNIYV
jgi:hypothetical protein